MHDDELGLLQRGARRDRIGAIELRLRVEHSRYALRGSASIACALRPPPAAARARVAADGVRGLGEEAERRAGRCPRAPARAPQAATHRDAAERKVAEQDRACSCPTAGWRRSPLPAGDGSSRASAAGTGLPRLRRRRDDDLGERLRHLRRRATSALCATGSSQSSSTACSDETCGALLAPPGAAAARSADGPCAGSCRRPARDRARRDRRSACRATECPRPAPSPRKSDWRRRKSMLSLPSPRVSCAASASSSSVACGDTSAPSAAAPCFATMSRQAVARRTSSAVCQSTAFHSPPCFTIGAVRRSSRVERLVREAVLVREPALVDRFVLERQHAHHAVVLHLHDEVAAERVVRRHATCAATAPTCAPRSGTASTSARRPGTGRSRCPRARSRPSCRRTRRSPRARRGRSCRAP